MNRVNVLLKLLSGITAALLINGCASSGIQKKNSEHQDSLIIKKFSTEELKSDFKFLINTLEEVHPALYARTSRQLFDEKRVMVEKSLDQSMTRLEFYKKIAPLVAELNEGHTGVNTPYDEIINYRSKSGKLFPFNVVFSDSETIIIKNFSDDLSIPVGSKLISINKIPINKIKDSLIQFQGFERYSMKVGSMQNFLRTRLYLIYGFTNNIEIEYILPEQKDIKVKQVEGIIYDSLLARINRSSIDPNKTDYKYYSLPKEKIGIIDFRSFHDADKFKTFLEETFSQIQKDSIKNLIIDIRENGGGNSQLGDELINYITDKPYRQCSRIEIKLSDQIREFYKSKLPWYIRWASFIGFEHFWIDSVTSDGIGIINEDYTKPDDNELRFKGKTYVLISGTSFSSAVMFASAIKDCKIGYLIGQETGGLATETGDIYPFTLPNTNLNAFVSHKRFVRPSGENDGKGVLPDIEVTPTIEDKLAGNDIEMELAKKIILTSRNIVTN